MLTIAGSVLGDAFAPVFVTTIGRRDSSTSSGKLTPYDGGETASMSSARFTRVAHSVYAARPKPPAAITMLTCASVIAKR